MRRIVCACLLVWLLLASCKTKGRRIWRKAPVIENQHKAAEPVAEAEIPARDYSITRENAYNDLFLDSLFFDKFLTEHVADDSIRENMLDFYNVRNFEFAWFDSKGLNEQALGFRSLYKFQSDSINKQLEKKLDELLLHENTIKETDSAIAIIELQLTRRFVEFSLAAYQEADLNSRQFETFIPIKKHNTLELADSVLKDSGSEKYAAINTSYRGLKKELSRYVALQHSGEWDSIPVQKINYSTGNSYPEIPAIKTRLVFSGELAENDSTAIFSKELKRAIYAYQAVHGFTADGKITASLIRSLNQNPISRIRQLLINMERMRWMPLKKTGKSIMVNIPEFMLHISEADTHVLHMRVVVGKEGHNTTMFSNNLSMIVFSPYWNVPPSIVKNEILPAMQKNKNYLEKNHMEIVRSSGGLPEIRQLPGAHNSLGRVKFLFPNSFNIYFHDTPSRNLFQNANRAASHGCIRLSDPVKMANYLLENEPEWTPEKIEAAMNQTTEKWVVLKQSVPVMITYYTAWVDEDNKLNFRDDIYKNDSVFAAKMFADLN